MNSVAEFSPHLAFVIALMVSAGYGTSWVRRVLDRRRRKARARHASRGEERAERLLRARGYKIVERQSVQPWDLHVNGEAHRVRLRADFLVRRRHRRYIAEVKTGTHVASLVHGPTRRQLLEYSHAFDVHGVLLVRVDESAIDEVVFPTHRPTRPVFSVRPWFLVGGLAATLLAVTAWLSP